MQIHARNPGIACKLDRAHSPIAANLGQTDLGAFYSDISYYTDPKTQAGVLDLGTNNWIPALTNDHSGCGSGTGPCVSAVLQQITGNVMRVFGQGPAGRIEPAVAGCTPESARNSVVFPAPFEPTRVTISPSMTSREMP